MKTVITITPKPGVLDPTGRAIEQGLSNLGYQGILGVTTGKHITLDLDEDTPARAEQKAAKMCETLLVNTVIEDYSIECFPASAASTDDTPPDNAITASAASTNEG